MHECVDGGRILGALAADDLLDPDVADLHLVRGRGVAQQKLDDELHVAVGGDDVLHLATGRHVVEVASGLLVICTAEPAVKHVEVKGVVGIDVVAYAIALSGLELRASLHVKLGLVVGLLLGRGSEFHGRGGVIIGEGGFVARSGPLVDGSPGDQLVVHEVVALGLGELHDLDAADLDGRVGRHFTNLQDNLEWPANGGRDRMGDHAVGHGLGAEEGLCGVIGDGSVLVAGSTTRGAGDLEADLVGLAGLQRGAGECVELDVPVVPRRGDRSGRAITVASQVCDSATVCLDLEGVIRGGTRLLVLGHPLLDLDVAQGDSIGSRAVPNLDTQHQRLILRARRDHEGLLEMSALGIHRQAIGPVHVSLAVGVEIGLFIAVAVEHLDTGELLAALQRPADPVLNAFLKRDAGIGMQADTPPAATSASSLSDVQNCSAIRDGGRCCRIVIGNC